MVTPRMLLNLVIGWWKLVVGTRILGENQGAVKKESTRKSDFFNTVLP
jgi:hypothetical protein